MTLKGHVNQMGPNPLYPPSEAEDTYKPFLLANGHSRQYSIESPWDGICALINDVVWLAIDEATNPGKHTNGKQSAKHQTQEAREWLLNDGPRHLVESVTGRWDSRLWRKRLRREGLL